MDRALQITYLFFIFLLITKLLPAQEKWKYSADLMESDKIKNVDVQRLNKNVRFVKEEKILLTDNAIRYVKDEVIHLYGNTMMINNIDTLTCDTMVYWSTIDSIYAIGNIRYVHGTDQGIFGDEMEIQYADSLIEMIRVNQNAFAYNNLNLRINKDKPYLHFRDEMSSKAMIAYFKEESDNGYHYATQYEIILKGIGSSSTSLGKRIRKNIPYYEPNLDE